MLRLLGAELVEVPAVPYANPNNYVKVSGRLAERLARTEPERRDLGQPVRQCRQPPGACRDDRAGDLGADRRQGRRLHLRRRHRAARSPASAMALKSAKPGRRRSASPIRWARRSTPITRPASSRAAGNSITEGIGQGRITANLEGLTLDRAPSRSPTRRRCPCVFDLLEHEGLCLGGSSGINVAGAIRLARQTRPRPHHRDDAVRLRHALSVASCSTPSSCAPRACRFPAGSNARSALARISSERPPNAPWPEYPSCG